MSKFSNLDKDMKAAVQAFLKQFAPSPAPPPPPPPEITAKRITSIQARTGAIVDALIFNYNDNDSSVSQIGGNGGGLSEVFVLGDERITSVTYNAATGYWKGCITGITFKTNGGKEHTFGSKGGKIHITAPAGEYIATLKGSTATVSNLR